MPFVELAGTDVHYLERGSGQPIVLVHGMNSAAACWEPIMEALADRYHVYAFDAPNHGFSANTPRGEPQPDWVDVLEHFLSALDIQRPILMGQSMGTMTVLRWAVRHPDEATALVTCGMGWPMGFGQPAEFPSPLDADEHIWAGVGSSFTQDWIDAHPLEFARYIRVRSTAVAIEADRYRRPFTFEKPSFDDDDPQMAAGLPNIQSPLMIFVGDQEAPPILAGAENVHAQVPNSTMHVMEGAGHNAYYQGRDLLLRYFDAFVAEQVRG
jgi:pimeloyl-ACP methyl ester carboxylesterase